MLIELTDGRKLLYQWDTGRRVRVGDKSIKEVHYSNRYICNPVTVEVAEDMTAAIPDELLQTWNGLIAYAYAKDESGCYTKVQADFPVHRRPKPSNYIYTPTERAGFDRLQKEIGDLSTLETTAKDNLVAAINEAAASGGADWAQNDLDGDGYVANRPGGYDLIETRKIFEMKLVSINDENMLTADADGSFAEGTPVHVSIDGAPEVTYNVAVTTTGSQTIYSFGSKSFDEVADGGLDATDYIVVWYEGNGKRAYQGFAGADLVGKTIVARADVATPVKIPDKYLELDSVKEIMKFTISYNRSSRAYESDRTYDELVAALNAGKLVLAKFGNVGMGEFYTYGWLYRRGMYVPGIWVYVGGDSPYQWECVKGNEWKRNELLRLGTGYTTPKKAGTAAYGTSDYASRDDHVHPSELPDVSADDDGKLLGVTGGAWGKVDKPSGDFVVTVNSFEADGTCTLDKTFAQIQEAIKGSKRVLAQLNYGGIAVSMPLALYNDASLIFGAPAFFETGIQQFNITVTANAAKLLVVQLLISYRDAMPQVSMAAAPTEAMQIATKKYVDDKECILQSTTPGSTKKFKVAVDDSGTLSAVEVT